jgi:hypothetical protein
LSDGLLGTFVEKPARQHHAWPTSPAFLVALALLVVNDWVLKPAVASWWTGKLSDVAGLFAFATFWSALLPRRRRHVCALTAVAFLLWKSEASGPAIEFWNTVAPWPVARVVDYTDWLALLVLVPVYGAGRVSILVAHRSLTARAGPSLLRRLGAAAAAAAAILAFAATSVRRSYPVAEATEYVVSAEPDVVRAALDSLGFEPGGRPARADTAADTISLYVRQPPESWNHVEVEVRRVGRGESRMRIVQHSGWSPTRPTSAGLDRAFRVQVIEPLREFLRRRS